VREGGSNGGCYCTVVIEEGLRWVRVGEKNMEREGRGFKMCQNL